MNPGLSDSKPTFFTESLSFSHSQNSLSINPASAVFHSRCLRSSGWVKDVLSWEVFSFSPLCCASCSLIKIHTLWGNTLGWMKRAYKCFSSIPAIIRPATASGKFSSFSEPHFLIPFKVEMMMSMLMGHGFVWLTGAQIILLQHPLLFPDGLALSETAERTQGPSKVPWNLSFCPFPFCMWPWAWEFWEGRAEEASVWGRSGSGIIAEGGNHWAHQTHFPVHDFHPRYRVRLKILTCTCDMEEGKKISTKHDLGGEASKRWRWMPTISYSDQEPCSSVVETLLGACVCVRMYVHTCARAHVCACMCVHVWGAYVYTCVHVYVCGCISVWVHVWCIWVQELLVWALPFLRQFSRSLRSYRLSLF